MIMKTILTDEMMQEIFTALERGETFNYSNGETEFSISPNGISIQYKSAPSTKDRDIKQFMAFCDSIHEDLFVEVCETFADGELEALEREKSELSIQIMKEELSRPNLTKEQILFWIHKFRKLNPKKLEHRRRLVNSFLNSVYLFDDKIIIDCNYKDGTETITFEEIENSALGSDLTSLAAPK